MGSKPFMSREIRRLGPRVELRGVDNYSPATRKNETPAMEKPYIAPQFPMFSIT
jgi:hypothetical protein